MDGIVERSKDLRTPQEIDGVLPWVCTTIVSTDIETDASGLCQAQVISSTHPYNSETEVTNETAAIMPPWQTESTISTVSSQVHLHSQVMLSLVETLIFQIAQQVSTKIITQLGMQVVATNLTAPVDPEAPHKESLVHHSSHKPAQDAANVMRDLRLGDGTTVSFSISSIPDPVAVTFVQDIPRLNAMWDDTSSHWGGESVLSIEGYPVPIVYWPNIYRYGKAGQWQGMKSRWTEWRVGH